MNKKGFLARAPFAVTYQQQLAAGSQLTSLALFTNPLANREYYEVLGIDAFWDVVSTSGTFDVRRVPVSTALTGGDRLGTGTSSTATGARTSTKIPLTTTLLTRQLRPGDTLALILAGTQTNLVGFTVAVWLQAMRGIRAR